MGTSRDSPIGAELRATVALAWPIMGAQILSLSMAFTDNVLVGRLGVEPLASLAMASGFYAIVVLAIMGLLSALSPLIAEAEGAGLRTDVGLFVGQGMRLALVVSLGAAALFVFSRPILLAFGQSPLLVDDAESYLRALAWGLPAQGAYVALRQFTEGVGASKPSVVVAGVAAVLNLPFAYAFIHGVWGVPRMGVAGAGYATSLLQWGMVLGLGAYVLRSRRYRSFALTAGLKARSPATMARILKLGIPLAAALVSEVGFFACSTFLAGAIGPLPQAAHQVALNAASFTFMAPFGLSIAVAIRIGRAVGRRDVEGIRRAALAGVGLTLAVQLAAVVLFLSVPRFIADVYSDDVDLIAVATRLLVIAGVFQVFDGLQVVGMGQMRGIKQTRAPLLVTLVAFWGVGAPWGYYCAFVLDLGVDGLWYGLLTGLGVAAVLHQLRFWAVYRRAVPS